MLALRGTLSLGLLPPSPPLVPPDAVPQHADELLIQAPVLAAGQLDQRRVEVGR